MASAGRGDLIRFGPFEFDLRSVVLRKAGKSLRLQPQPARILGFLISRAGKLVTREELRQEIWGASTFVDFEHNLNFGVRQIRTVLHDNAKRPRFIETLPRRGYRFVAAVKDVPAQAIHSLAVLPLENLSQDPEQEYFADGITDELITQLAKIGALRVVSRTSVQQYKRARQPLPEIARPTTNNACQINPLQIEYRVCSGNDLREADRPPRERAGKKRVGMTQHQICPSALYNIIAFSCFDNI